MQGKCAAATRAAMILLGTIAALGPAWAEVVAPGVVAGPVLAPQIDQFGKEMTVQNWILCTSQAYAESIAKARADSINAALKVYGDLSGSKSCGVMPVLKVILRQQLYQSPASEEHQTHVYRASVNFGTEWPTGFLISGGLSD